MISYLSILHKISVVLIILSFLSEINSKCFAQESGKIIYKTILESEDFKELKAILLINEGTTSFFVKNTLNSDLLNGQNTDFKDDSNEKFDLDFDIKPPKDELMYQVHIDETSNQIRSRRTIFKGGRYIPCVVVEPTNLINWELLDESKSIGSFTVYKAKSSFRGRNYSAWYTPDTSIKAGPWKFQGLPGLILEVYDDEKGVQFIFESMEIPYNGESEIIYPDEKMVLTIDEYAEMSDPNEVVNEFIDWISSELPEGAAIIDPSTISIDVNHKGIEREFE